MDKDGKDGRLLFIFFTAALLVDPGSLNTYFEDDIKIHDGTAFEEASNKCLLFGTQLEKSTSVVNIQLLINSTKNVWYWIGAGISFKRWINPIGEIVCKDSKKVASFTEFIRFCAKHRYFSYEKEDKCACLPEDTNVRSFGIILPCNEAVCAVGKRCVVYEYVYRAEKIKCETVTFPSRTYHTSTCTDGKTDGYICQDGTYNVKKSLTWYEALTKCSDKNGLIRRDTGEIEDVPPPGKYWVSLFRQIQYSWGYSGNQYVCVAASIQKDGWLNVTTKGCSEELPSICHTKLTSKGILTYVLPVGFVILFDVVCLVVGFVLCKKYVRINNQPLVVLRRKERFCGNQKTHENEALHQNTHGTAGFARCAYPYSMAVIVNDTEESYKENDDDYDNTLHHSAADYQGHVKNNTLAGNHQSNSFTTDCEENPYDT